MKHGRPTRLYNVLFPIWFLMYLYPSWLPLAVLAFNFAFDSLVLVLAARWQKLTGIRRLWRQIILKVWLLGFAADILGALLNLAVYFGCDGAGRAGRRMGRSAVRFLASAELPRGDCVCHPRRGAAGWLIYWLDRRFAFRRTGLPAQTADRLCLVLAIATTPYTMLIPLYAW